MGYGGYIGKVLPTVVIKNTDIAPGAISKDRLQAGLLESIKTVTSNTSLTLTDVGTILVDATGGNVTITLPTANATNVFSIIYRFIRIDTAIANTVTINPTGSDKIGNLAGTSFLLTVDNYSAIIVSDSVAAWRINGGLIQSPTSGRKNYLINGSFQIWQRALAPFSYGGGTSGFTADRWSALRNVANYSVGYGSSLPPTGFLSYARITRTNGTSDINPIFLTQVLESANSVGLQGKQVTLSYWARRGTFATPGVFGFDFWSGAGIDQSTAALHSVSWTSQTQITSGTVALTLLWQRFTKTVTISTTTTQLGLRFNYTPAVGLADTNDYVDVAGVQLEEGPVPTEFERQTFGHELAQCQRYYCKSFAYGTTPTTAVGSSTGEYLTMIGKAGGGQNNATSFPFPVTMRTLPTISLYSPVQNSSDAWDETLGGACTSTSPSFYSPSAISWTFASNGGSTVGNLAGIHFTADAEL